MPCQSSTTCVLKTSRPEADRGRSACSAAALFERARRVPKLRGVLVDAAASREDAPASWRRRSVVVIFARASAREEGCRRARRRRRL